MGDRPGGTGARHGVVAGRPPIDPKGPNPYLQIDRRQNPAEGSGPSVRRRPEAMHPWFRSHPPPSAVSDEESMIISVIPYRLITGSLKDSIIDRVCRVVAAGAPS